MSVVAESPAARALPAMTVIDEERAFAHARLLCLAAILAFALLFFAAQVRLYQAGTMRITDLADFVQPLHGLLHGTPWQISIEHEAIDLAGTRSVFSEHLFLFLFALVPFYAVAPHVYTLFALQAVVPPLGAFLILLIARDQLRSTRLALCLSLAYLLYLPLQWTTLNGIHYGFHLENFFPPLFLLGHYLLWQRRQAGAALLAFTLALTVVESYAVLLACYALYLALCGRRRTGLVLLLLSGSYFVAAQLVIIPHFRQGAAASYLSVFGTMRDWETTLQMLSLVPHAAASYCLFALVPLLGLPLLDWRMLAVALPTLGINFLALLGGYDVPASPRSWHTNPIIPICFLAAIGGLARLATHPRVSRHMVQGLGLALLVVGLALAGGKGPLRGVFLRPSPYIVEYRAPALVAVAPLIPSDASLSADLFLGGNFVQRAQLHIFPAAWEQSDYVLLDLNTLAGYREVLEQIERDPAYHLLYRQGSVYLFTRRP
jgi:uncharacterized membrane protein